MKNSRSKIIVISVMTLLFVSGIIFSVYAAQEITENKALIEQEIMKQEMEKNKSLELNSDILATEESTKKSEEEKRGIIEEGLMIRMLEKICDIPTKEPVIRSDAEKQELKERFLQITSAEKTENDSIVMKLTTGRELSKQDLIEMVLKLWPEIKTGVKSAEDNFQEEKWNLIEELLSSWPFEHNLGNIAAEMEEKRRIEEEAVKKAKHKPGTTFTEEEAKRRSLEEKRKIEEEVAKKNFESANNPPVDIPPTEESIRQSMEEKQKLIEEAMKNGVNFVHTPLAEESTEQVMEERQEIPEESTNE